MCLLIYKLSPKKNGIDCKLEKVSNLQTLLHGVKNLKTFQRIHPFPLKVIEDVYNRTEWLLHVRVCNSIPESNHYRVVGVVAAAVASFGYIHMSRSGLLLLLKLPIVSIETCFCIGRNSWHWQGRRDQLLIKCTIFIFRTEYYGFKFRVYSVWKYVLAICKR